jgi:hypothetical protein
MKQFRFIAIVMLLVLLLLLVLLTQKVNQPEMRPQQQKTEQDSLLFYRLCDHFVDLYPRGTGKTTAHPTQCAPWRWRMKRPGTANILLPASHGQTRWSSSSPA